MLADKKYKVNEIASDFIKNESMFSQLANRFQIWQLINHEGKHKYLGLGHFPFSKDALITDKRKLSDRGHSYCDLVSRIIDHYANEPFIFCADFNLSPYLISEWKDREMDMIINNNSILLTTEDKSNSIDTVTVDGILLSAMEKQRYYHSRFNLGLFARLKREDNFIQSHIKDHLIQNRHKGIDSQRAYDERFGLALR